MHATRGAPDMRASRDGHTGCYPDQRMSSFLSTAGLLLT
jgi:hypothetical protein